MLKEEKNYQITVMGGPVFSVPEGTTYEQVSKNYAHLFKAPIVLAKMNHTLKELNYKIRESGDIQFYDLTNPEGRRVYIRSVSFLMIKAVKDVLGLDTKVVVENSLKKNYYCEIHKPGVTVDEPLLEKIEGRMRQLVEEDALITKSVYTREQATELVLRFHMEDKAKLFRYRRSSNITLYHLDGFYDYFYGYMVPSCGYLKGFRLTPYENGFLILFPSANEPENIEDMIHLEKITAVFMEQSRWCQLMKVKNVSDLDDVIANGEFGNLVRINEALHEKKIAQIADKITEKADKVKIVLIAGPSSSGKTTFAQRLCVQLRVNGILPHVISLDDYFINRDQTPVNERGEHDFESIYALDLPLFNDHLQKLIAGERIELPYYNFVTGKREYRGKTMKLDKGEIVVIEGIHGLNDLLTSQVPAENKFKIFISAMTQLNVDDHNCISTSDSRLIRRIVRDYQFRGNSAQQTIATWPNVTSGEAKNIFPYQENADVVFNSATIYEICVLKQYIEPLLFHIDPSLPEFVTAKRIIKFLDYFLCAGSECIPNNSIIREFIGGSVFHV